MSNFLESFGKKIKNYRELRGYTQEQLIEKLDIATTTLSAWENGKAFPKYDSLVKLCATLEIKEEDLFAFKIGKTGNKFIDELNEISLLIPPTRHKQVLDILKTFVE